MSEVRLVVAILVPAIFTLILKDFFDLFMTNRYEGKVKQYTILYRPPKVRPKNLTIGGRYFYGKIQL